LCLCLCLCLCFYWLFYVFCFCLCFCCLLSNDIEIGPSFSRMDVHLLFRDNPIHNSPLGRGKMSSSQLKKI
jgi:hypothetical protein